VRGHGSPAPREVRRAAWSPGEDSEAGRVLAALRSHPRGLALPVLTRVCDLPDATLKGIMPRLVQAGLAVRPAKGFYKATPKESTRETEATAGQDELEARRAARA
jgi:DNA-binding IclR family transcriptional regulator